MLHNHFPVRRLCSLFTAAALTLSLGVTGYAETRTGNDHALLAPQTEDDPQYGAEYQKYYGEPDAEEDATMEAADFSLQRTTDTTNTFEYTSPYTGETYTVTGNEEDLALGVDVSYYQDEIDWAAAKADGVEFAFIRAAYRGYSQAGNLVTDTQFYNNLAGARDQDIKVGIYIYSQATTVEEAREEAEYVLALIEDYKLELPIIFDQEFAEYQSGGFMGRLYDAYTACATDEEKAAFLTDLCLAFCETIAEAGYTPMIYASTSHFNRMDMTRITDPVWVAQYSTSKVRLESPYAFWQYSASGTVEGIPGKVDCDFSVDPAYLDCSSPSDAETTSRIVITPENYPKGTITAKAFSLTGSILSALPLTSVTAELLDSEGNVVQSCTDAPLSDTEYIIKGSPIDNGMKFAQLELGSYILRYTAEDQAGTQEVWESEPFEVASEEPEESEKPEEPAVPSNITIAPVDYPKGNFTAKSFALTGTITSDLPLTEVTAAIVRADGKEIQSCKATVSDITSYEIKSSVLDREMRFANLTSGYYYLTYSATDTNGTTETWQSDVFAVADTKLFPDVTNSSIWYYSYIYKAASLGLVNGVGTADGVFFYPNSALTRAQVVCILYRAAGSPSVDGQTHPFTDAKASWYQNALIWAYQEGIINGVSATSFAPNSSATREQVAVMLYKFNGASPAETDYLSGYTDAAKVSSWAKTEVNWCISQEIFSSTSTEKLVFSPQNNSTRAQAATLLSRYMDKFQ